MARTFLTKVWGFDPGVYPALGFNSVGGRSKFLRESQPGDWVILAGTRSRPTELDDQGRLLGMVQLGPQEVDVEEVLRSVGTPIPADHYLPDGSYRWAYGLPMITALRFVDKPDIAGLFGDYLPGTQWASYALDLAEKVGPDAPARIHALRTEPVDIVDAPAIIRQRELQRALQLGRSQGPTGPGPSSGRAGSSRDDTGAFAYLLQMQGARRTVFKVGYSTDVADRVVTLNKGLVPAVTGCSWRVVTTQPFATEAQAYRFEQALHAKLRRSLVEGETEIYAMTKGDIETHWIGVLSDGSWALE